MTHPIPRDQTFAAGEPWEEAAPRIDELSRDVRESLAAVPPVELRTIDLDGGDTDVLVGSTVRPEAVLMGAVTDKDAGATPSSVPGLHWERARGGLRVIRTYGLTSGTRYSVTLVVIGGAR